jgi:ApaG protein
MSKKQPLFDVQVTASYVSEQSSVQYNHHVFKYTVTICNNSATTATLLSRHWIITDAKGDVHELHGVGVVGEQPCLKPGEKFEYTSGAVLSTPIGLMQGSYQMCSEDGKQFAVKIAPFSLAKPRILH